MRAKLLTIGIVLVLSLGAGGHAAASTMDADSFLCPITVGIHKLRQIVDVGPDLMTPVDAALGCEPSVDD